MDLRKTLERKIANKQAEAQSLREDRDVIDLKLRDIESFIGGLQEALRVLPASAVDNQAAVKALRPNSDAAKVRNILIDANEPLHISAILAGLGRDVNKKTRGSLSGQLGFHVRNGTIFTRPKPNTFGLVEWEESSESDNGKAKGWDIFDDGSE